MKRRLLVTADEAQPAKEQHRKPCGDCPWRRDSVNGWLGSLSIDEWLAAAHGEARIDCHTKIGPQCAGAATYRRNVCKRPRDPAVLVLEEDRERVFASPAEFRAHHERAPKKRRDPLEKWPPQPRPAELAGEPSEDMKVAINVRGIADSLAKRR